MRKRFFNGKRILTLMLALSLVVGETGVVFAAPAEKEQPQTSVSANEVAPETDATGEVKVQDSDVSAEAAYNGTVSKVIGLKGTVDSDGAYRDENRNSLRFTRVNPLPYKTMIRVENATLDTYRVKDATGNLFYYDGRYYEQAYMYAPNCINLSNPITFLDAAVAQDPVTGLYPLADGYVDRIKTITVGGQVKNYVYVDRYVILGTYASEADAYAAKEAAAVSANIGTAAYYFINGKFYDAVHVSSSGSQVVMYASVYNEITFEGHKVNLTWNELSTDNIYVYDNKEIKIGYQVEENGVVQNAVYKSTDGQYAFTKINEFESDLCLFPGQSTKYRVRGLYYTESEATDAAGNEVTLYNVFSVGEWSDTYTYTAPALTKLATVTGLRTELESYDGGYDFLKIHWNAVPEATAYEIDYIRSDRALNGITTENWDRIMHTTIGAKEINDLNPGAKWTPYTGAEMFDNGYNLSGDRTKDTYFYIRVKATKSEVNGYVDGDFSEIISGVIEKKTAANIPAIQNFRVEYMNNGKDFRLAWTPVKAKVVLFVAEKAKGFPQWYTARVTKPYTTDAATGKKLYLTDALDEGAKAILEREVDYITLNGSNGYTSDSEISRFNLKPGVEYNFVAYTYDTLYANEAKTPIGYNGVNYDHYADLGPATATLTAKMNLSKPSVEIETGVDSLKLVMTGYSSSATGFEIYKKSGKKYKKVTTTTDIVYVDTDVKKNTKYNYKVRAYYYDKDSKAKCYSSYVYIAGETSDVANMKLDATKKSKTSVTLKWTKIKGATKYEIYRTNMRSYDILEKSKKNSVGSKKDEISEATKYELVKTLKGSAKPKYTDKKLVKGDTYSYLVKAYYKNGKSTLYTSASDTVVLDLESPKLRGSIKGSTVKLAWDKDKFASNYEVRYVIYNEEGDTTNVPTYADEYTYVSTKKTSISIPGVPVGGKAVAFIRAYGDKKYTDWGSETHVKNGLDATKNIKATNVTVKNADGVDVNAIKITWKAVSGAKYYKVYRSTRQGEYNSDNNKYRANGNYIAKESNDDENKSADEVPYREYMNLKGSIVGTTAYDFAPLDTGVTYHYYVVAFGESHTDIYTVYDEDNSIQTYGSGKPATVTYKASVDPTLKSKKGKAAISWDKVPGATKYNVYRSTKKNKGYQLVGSTKKATYTDKKVSKGKTYYYKIEATGTNDLKANFTSMSSAKKIKVKK